MSERRATRWLALACAALGAWSAGCRDAGRGGTGEIVVPRERLRSIAPLDLSRHAAPDAPQSPSTQPATPVEQVEITIEQVRQAALENNLDLKVELLSPSISRQAISEEEARFEAVFRADASWSSRDQPTASELAGSQVENYALRPGIDIPLRTGGTARVAAPLDRLESDNRFTTLNPAYSSDLDASISQPLLRGAGVYVNAQAIRVAFYADQITEARTKLEVIRTLAAADRTYWRLHAARLRLDVRRKEFDLAQAQLERARRRVRAGEAAEVEVIRAESGVADRLEAIILSENELRNAQRELKRIMQRGDLPMESTTALTPVSRPGLVAYRLRPVELANDAMRQRMEMLEIELQIARQAATIDVARNDTLPLLALDYGWTVNGLGGEFNDAVSQASTRDFQDHRLGLRLEVPIGNEAARSRLRRAILTRLQQLATQAQRAEQVRLEVFDACDALDAAWQRILAARQRSVLAMRTMEAETRQFDQGLRTSTDVLDAQARLADAQAAEVNAVAQYQIAQVDLAVATGTLLGASRVVWQPFHSPDGSASLRMP